MCKFQPPAVYGSSVSAAAAAALVGDVVADQGAVHGWVAIGLQGRREQGEAQFAGDVQQACESLAGQHAAQAG